MRFLARDVENGINYLARDVDNGINYLHWDVENRINYLARGVENWMKLPRQRRWERNKLPHQRRWEQDRTTSADALRTEWNYLSRGVENGIKLPRQRRWERDKTAPSYIQTLTKSIKRNSREKKNNNNNKNKNKQSPGVGLKYQDTSRFHVQFSPCVVFFSQRTWRLYGAGWDASHDWRSVDCVAWKMAGAALVFCLLARLACCLFVCLFFSHVFSRLTLLYSQQVSR